MWLVLDITDAWEWPKHPRVNDARVRMIPPAKRSTAIYHDEVTARTEAERLARENPTWKKFAVLEVADVVESRTVPYMTIGNDVVSSVNVPYWLGADAT
jgi:hypothetical protein